MKRVFLFLATNIAILALISLILGLTGANRFLTANGLDYQVLLVYSAIVGFTGSIVSLLMSKFIAKMSVGAQVIKDPRTEEEAWLVATIKQLAIKAHLPMPEVAIYEGAPNAFATGATKSSSLVAVSTGLLRTMNRRQVEAVLAHEISHVANGDMVTLTLIQGVVNTFVVFLSKVAAFFVDKALSSRDEDEGAHHAGLTFYICDLVFQILFGFLASLIVFYFSRHREYRADAGAGRLLGSNEQMIDALRVLGSANTEPLPQQMAASGIAGGKSFMELFSTHPTIEQRIAALQKNALV